MALNRPKISVPSAAQSAQFIGSNSKFLSLKDGQTALLRFMPVPDGVASIFFPAHNHHGLKREDGDGQAALACLEQHGTKETGTKCAICDVLGVLADTDKEGFKSILSATNKRKRVYTQVLQALMGKDERGKPAITGWSKPLLIQWSMATYAKLQAILKSMEDSGEDLFYDPDHGQALYVTRTGGGFDTEYQPERSSVKCSLESIRPTWGEEFIDDVMKVVALNIYDRQTQLAYMQRTFPKLPWTELLNAIGEEDRDV